MRGRAGLFLGHVIFAGKRLGLPVESDQILMRRRPGVRRRLVGLEVKPELEVVGEELLRRLLVGVQEDVLVVAAGQPSLVRVHPAGGILLLHEVAPGFREAVLGEGDAVDGALYSGVADARGGVQTGEVQGRPAPKFWPVIGKVWARSAGSDDWKGRRGGGVKRVVILRLPLERSKTAALLSLVLLKTLQ